MGIGETREKERKIWTVLSLGGAWKDPVCVCNILVRSGEVPIGSW